MTSNRRELSLETKEFLTQYPEVREDFLTFMKYMAKQSFIGKDGAVVKDIVENTGIGYYHMGLIVEFLKATGAMSNRPENPDGQAGVIEWAKT